MDDLLDLSWSSKPIKVNNQQKKDAFAGLLPSSSNTKSNDNSKLSLLEQKKQQQTTSWTSPVSIENVSSTKPVLSQNSPLFPSNSPINPSNNQQKNTPTSFEDMLNPFATNKKTEASNKNTPINQLQNVKQTEDNTDQWNFDLLNTSSNSAVNTNTLDFDISKNEKTTNETIDIFDLPVLEQKAQKIEAHETVYDDDNPLGILAEPVQPKKSSSVQETVEMTFDEENPLGILTEPVQNNFPVQGESNFANSSTQIGLEESAEDEMLAKIIDMGFSLQQAKFAIEATGHLQTAIDLLMQNSEPALRTQASSIHKSIHEHTSNPRGEDLLHIQTEKFVGQAQELGGMLYKNASSFLKIGREKVTKAVGDWQEQQRTQRLKQLQEQQKGPVRPKWMTDNIESVDITSRSVERFEDDKIVSPNTQPKMQRPHQPKVKPLFNDIEAEYVSPSRRRGGPSGRSTPTVTVLKDTAMRPQESISSPAPKLAQKTPERTRPLVNASPDTMARVNQARAEGNKKFKLGQFGEAEEAYSRAIELLPAGHDHQVVLLNNRAMSRLKTGNHKQCIADCDISIKLSEESGLSTVSEGLTIQWRDQLLKSLNRKAEALENIEKYKEALVTYEKVLSIEGPGQKLNQSLARCRHALNPVAKAKTQKTPASTIPVNPQELDNSKAVAEMRAKAAKQEAEDAEKLLKTDETNERLSSWKANKEQNLRALLATLDTLLWPGAQWKGAQMSDLIDIKKCKITYMKAISKVHPDKLPSDATVEQKMLASGIFASLNQAWDAFRLQNNI